MLRYSKNTKSMIWRFMADFLNYLNPEFLERRALITDTLIKLYKYDTERTLPIAADLSGKIQEATSYTMFNDAWLNAAEKLKAIFSNAQYSKQLAVRIYLCYFICAALGDPRGYLGIANLHADPDFSSYLKPLITHLKKQCAKNLPKIAIYYEDFDNYTIGLLYKTAFDLFFKIKHDLSLIPTAQKINYFLAKSKEVSLIVKSRRILAHVIQVFARRQNERFIAIIDETFQVWIDLAKILLAKSQNKSEKLGFIDSIYNNFSLIATTTYPNAYLFSILSKIVSLYWRNKSYETALKAINTELLRENEDLNHKSKLLTLKIHTIHEILKITSHESEIKELEIQLKSVEAEATEILKLLPEHPITAPSMSCHNSDILIAETARETACLPPITIDSIIEEVEELKLKIEIPDKTPEIIPTAISQVITPPLPPPLPIAIEKPSLANSRFALLNDIQHFSRENLTKPDLEKSQNGKYEPGIFKNLHQEIEARRYAFTHSDSEDENENDEFLDEKNEIGIIPNLNRLN